MIRLLVADDHPVVRSGIRNLLRDAPDIRVAAEAATVADVLQQIEAHQFDAILLDLSFPDGTGLDLIPVLRERRPPVPAIIFTNAVDAAARCIEAGAAAFLSKEAGMDEIRSAIAAALRGKVFVGSRAARLSNPLETRQTDEKALPHTKLSRRELDIMLKLVRGMRPKEIACELGISEKTVATHRARLMRKLNLSDNRQLLLYALRAGLTDWC